MRFHVVHPQQTFVCPLCDRDDPMRYVVVVSGVWSAKNAPWAGDLTLHCNRHGPWEVLVAKGEANGN